MSLVEYTTGERADEAFAMTPPPWRSDARCRGCRMPEEWVPLFGPHVLDLFFFDGPPTPARKRALEKVCGSCPVQADCAEWALRHESYGYWANTSPGWRVEERSRQGILLLTPEVDAETRSVIGTTVVPGHGTDARYQAHIKAGEQACEACREQHNLVEALRRQPRRESAEEREARLATDRQQRDERRVRLRRAGLGGLTHGR
jgi:hypothetical protein